MSVKHRKDKPVDGGTEEITKELIEELKENQVAILNMIDVLLDMEV